MFMYFDSCLRLGASPVHKFSNRARFEGNPGVTPSTLPTTSSASAIRIREDMSYLVDQSIPDALVESLSGSVSSVPSDLAQNPPGMAPSFDVHFAVSKSHPPLGLGSPCVSGSSCASPVSSRSRSGSTGSSFTMEIPENMSLLREEPLADLAGVDDSWY